jgi:nucleoside-diphosphate-sugar epimerase
VNVFLAGATGAVGRPCLSILTARGHRVFAMTRDPGRARELWDAGVLPVVADVFDAELMRAAVMAARPDVVMHQLTDLGMLREPGKAELALARNSRIRTVGSANLVNAAVAAGVQHLVAQSIAWAYRPGDEPHDEDAPLELGAPGVRGVTIDGVVALEAATLRTPALHGCVLRYGLLYGPGTGNVAPADARRPALHVEAAAWAAVLAAEQGARGVYNVAEPHPSVRTEKIRRALGWEPSLRVVDRPGSSAVIA